MRKRTCWQCGGSGREFDWFSSLLNFASWTDWQRNAYKRRRGCSGRGWWWEDWRDYAHRYGRR